MTSRQQQRRAARRRRRAGRRRLTALLTGIGIAAVAVLVVALTAGGGRPSKGLPLGAARPGPGRRGVTSTAPAAPAGPPSHAYGRRLAPAGVRVNVLFKRPPQSGLLFDLDTGQVLWHTHPERRLPIASLTKMMTALVVVAHERASARVRATRAALAYKGSGIGILPRGKRIRLETMLYGLLLPSGNDAAIALAQRVAGTLPRFVAMMNRRARRLGLTCTRFSSPDGFEDAGNHSCAPDLALLAHAVLARRRLARIVGSRSAILPFPIKGGHVFLYNNNPLLRTGFPGATGVKTGYTDLAGRCLVASARRAKVRLAVVLLHSSDPPGQAKTLLDAGFRAMGVTSGTRGPTPPFA